MKADWTNGEPLITKALNSFGKAGVPLYVIFPATSTQKPIILPEILTKKIIITNIKKAKKQEAVFCCLSLIIV